MTNKSGERERKVCRFADLTLDPGQRIVRRGDHPIDLTGKSFDVLYALVRMSPDAVSIDVLMEDAWSGSVVSDATVAKRIELIRNALGDDSNSPRYIALVRGHGYRLIPEVRWVADSRSFGSNRMRAGVIAGIVVGLALIAWLAFRPVSAPAPERSVAVLPFVSLSGDPDDRLFADGLTDELSHVLASDAGLRVTGRASAYHFRDSEEDSATIGDALGVAHLLWGSVRRDGDELRITAQLIDAEEGFSLWSASYDRRMDDIITIQRDIALNVARSLQATLGGSPPAPEIDSSAIDPETYAIYLRAVSLSPYGKFVDLAEAQRLIEIVLERAPDFAPAWNRLCAIHGRRLFGRDPGYDMPPEESLLIMSDAVRRALAIDPVSAEAFANLGGIAWVFEGDAVKAAQLIEQAVELDPHNLDIIAFAAEFAKFIGRLDEALELEEFLVSRDPLCDFCRYRLAKTYLFTARFDAAVHELETLQFLEPRYNWDLGIGYLMLQQPAKALEKFEQIGDTFRQFALQGRAVVSCSRNDTKQADVLLAQLYKEYADTQSLLTAQAFAWCERNDTAFEVLEQLLAEPPVVLQTNYLTPLFNPVRNDPRWQALLHEIGRAPDQVSAIPFSLDIARIALDEN